MTAAFKSKMVQFRMPFMPELGSAVVSECGTWRYKLSRSLDHLGVNEPLTETGVPRKRCLFIMLNPSTADAIVPDPTVDKCVKLARAWGHQRLDVGNIFAFRATEPKELRKHSRDHIVGPYNLGHLLTLIQEAHTIVFGWGQHGTLHGQDRVVEDLVTTQGKTPFCIKQNKDGTPIHPLYQLDESKLMPYVRKA